MTLGQTALHSVLLSLLILVVIMILFSWIKPGQKKHSIFRGHARLAMVFGKFTYEDSNQKEFLIFMI